MRVDLMLPKMNKYLDFKTPTQVEAGKDSLDYFLFYFSLIISIISTYIFSVQNVEWILYLKRTLFVVVPLLFGARLLYLKKINLWYYFLSLLIGTYFFFTRRSDVIAEFILLSWCIFSCKFLPEKIKSQNITKTIGFTLCLVVGVHFYFFEMYGRESIGGLDPNYTSFLIFMIFPFALVSRSVSLHILITLLGLMTHSRAFLMAIVFYFFTMLIIRMRQKISINFKCYFIILISFLAFVLLYSFYGYSIGPQSYGIDRYGPSRVLYILNNPSDYPRWKANVVLINQCFSDLRFMLLGMEPLKYLKSIYMYLPHNVFLLEIATHGLILGFIFICFFILFIRRIYDFSFLPFLLGIFIYWFFLGIEIGAIYNVYLIQVLMVLDITREKVV